MNDFIANHIKGAGMAIIPLFPEILLYTKYFFNSIEMVDIELLMVLLYQKEFDLLTFLKSGEVDVNEKLCMMDNEALDYFLNWYVMPNEEYELASLITQIMNDRASC